MADQNAYPYPSPATQLEQLAAAGAQQASSPTAPEYATPEHQRPPNPRKRRADGSSVSTRGVANLTPEQLAKKRANDREAQRAIRERTRSNIETLQRRIAELEGQQPFQELQSVVRARDAVIAENEELKKRLSSIAALTQYQSGGHGLDDLALATAQQAPLPLPGQQSQQREQHSQSSYHGDYSQTGSATGSSGQQHLHPDLRNLQSHHAPTATMHSSNGDDTVDDPSVSDWQRVPPSYESIEQDSESSPAFGTALQNLVSSRRDAIESGLSPNSVLGPHQPSFTALVPSDAMKLDTQSPSLSAEISQLVESHLSSTETPARVATAYIAFVFIRWLLAPSQESFDRIPEWLRPTSTQLTRPHPVWMDLVPWSQSRNRAVTASPDPQLYYATFPSLSLNWPYDQSLCLMKSGDEDDWTVNPVFEAHLRVLDHWSVPSDVRDGRDEGLEGLLQGLGSAASGETHA